MTATLKSKKRIRSLKDPRLRRIRFQLRVLSRLLYKEEYKVLTQRISDQMGGNYLESTEKTKKRRELMNAREKLTFKMLSSPIICALCGNQMEDLVFNPQRQCWFCIACFEDAHKNYPEEYP